MILVNNQLVAQFFMYVYFIEINIHEKLCVRLVIYKNLVDLVINIYVISKFVLIFTS